MRSEDRDRQEEEDAPVRRRRTGLRWYQFVGISLMLNGLIVLGMAFMFFPKIKVEGRSANVDRQEIDKEFRATEPRKERSEIKNAEPKKPYVENLTDPALLNWLEEIQKESQQHVSTGNTGSMVDVQAPKEIQPAVISPARQFMPPPVSHEVVHRSFRPSKPDPAPIQRAQIKEAAPIVKSTPTQTTIPRYYRRYWRR